MLNILRRRAGEKRIAEGLYDAIVARSRDARFYTELGVADTFDGRFDLLVLHGWLVLDALKAQGLEDVEQRLTQMLFVGFEDALRDQGAGDMAIGRRSKAMTTALFGRIQGYRTAGADKDALATALERNLYRGAAGKADCARRVAHYITETQQALDQTDLSTGTVPFASLA